MADPDTQERVDIELNNDGEHPNSEDSREIIDNLKAQMTSLVAEVDKLKRRNQNLTENFNSLETNNNELRAEVRARNTYQEPGSLTIVLPCTICLVIVVFSLTLGTMSRLQTDETTTVDVTKHLEEEIQQLKQEMNRKLSEKCNRHKTLSLDPPILIMTRFNHHKTNKDQWTSNPVYTHHQGYKICLRVIANGSSFGKGTHVSVFIHFMRGEFDDSLKWPFRGIVSFRLLDQVKGEDHKEGKVTYDDNVVESVCTRVTEGEVGKGEWGYIQFIPHTKLEPKYLQDDTLIFQIYEVELH